MNKRTIVITGATKGIGRELSFHFASKQEYNLALASRDNNMLLELKKQLKDKYPNINILIYAADISKNTQVKKMFEAFINSFKNIDILINNAAIAGVVGSISDIDIDKYKHTIDVNLYGATYCTIESLKSMKKNSYGKIINICGAGVGWDAKSLNKSAYITSKYALYGLTESLSRELKEFGIDINCISPGSYDTNLRDRLISKDDTRINAPQKLSDISETLGSLMDFLISDKSDGLSGKILSAIYDNPDEILNNIENIKNTSDYTIRKIDKINYFRKIDG